LHAVGFVTLAYRVDLQSCHKIEHCRVGSVIICYAATLFPTTLQAVWQ
jgi:hypothetical protein